MIKTPAGIDLCSETCRDIINTLTLLSSTTVPVKEQILTYRIAILCTLLLLSACGPDNNAKAPPAKLFADQRSVLDKAKTVDPEQQKHDEEQRKAIDEQTK